MSGVFEEELNFLINVHHIIFSNKPDNFKLLGEKHKKAARNLIPDGF